MTDPDSLDHLDQPQPQTRYQIRPSILDLQSSTTTSTSRGDQDTSRSDTPTHTHTSAQDEDVTMLTSYLPTAIGGHGHMFSGAGSGKNPAAIQMELQQLKSSPILNPHYRMIQRYIDCLNWYIDVCVQSQGATGIRAWMYEVQWFTTAVQKRAYQRMPLTMEERHAIIHFTTYWRQQAHNPYMMGRPEVQVVLCSLAEVAQT